MRVSVAWLILVAACYSPTINECTIRCDSSGDCPSDTICAADKFCHLDPLSQCGAGADGPRGDGPRADGPRADGGFDARLSDGPVAVDGAVGVDGPRAPDGGLSHPTLTIVGASSFSLSPGESVQLLVRYADDNRPLAATIGFRIEGDARGSKLSATSAKTDANGTARVTVTAGERMTRFAVVGELGSLSVRWEIMVRASAEQRKLRIIGDANRFGAAGGTIALAVQLLDNEGKPTNGTIHFEILGDGRGASVPANAPTTGSDATARVMAQLGSGPALFQITANAVGAETVHWNIGVSSGTPIPARAVGTDTTEPHDRSAR